MPIELTIVLSFLNCLSELCYQGSSQILSYAKNFFSINNISKFLKPELFKGWMPLKLEFLNFLTVVYVMNKKLEDNEENDLQYCIGNSMYDSLSNMGLVSNFNDFTLNSDVTDIFERNLVYSSKNNLKIVCINFKDSVYQFIHLGVLETLKVKLKFNFNYY